MSLREAPCKGRPPRGLHHSGRLVPTPAESGEYRCFELAGESVNSARPSGAAKPWRLQKEGFEKYYLFGADGQIRFSGGSGYRLPLETEWEYACRAGAMTSRYYGDSEELLGKYARYIENSRGRGLVIGGKLKPNDFGLFDMLGNTLEWCHDPSPESGDRRILRGGSHLFIHEFVRSACRLSEKPSDEDVNYGFRVAKTFR